MQRKKKTTLKMYTKQEADDKIEERETDRQTIEKEEDDKTVQKDADDKDVWREADKDSDKDGASFQSILQAEF